MGYDVQADDGSTIKFANPPRLDKKIFVTAFLKDSFLKLPNAEETTIGGIKVRIDQATSTVYVTSDGSNP